MATSSRRSTSSRCRAPRRQLAVHVVAIRFELRFPLAHTLKERRAHVRPVVDGIRHRFHLSVAEVGDVEAHREASIGVAIVSADARQCEKIADEVSRFVWAGDHEVVDEVHTWTEFD